MNPYEIIHEAFAQDELMNRIFKVRNSIQDLNEEIKEEESDV